MKGKKNELYYAAITAVLVLAALVTLLLDYGKLGSILARTDFYLILCAVLFTAVSYIAHSFSFWSVCRIFKASIPSRELLEIGFVSSSLTNVLSAAGLPGHTYRIITMKRNRVAAGDVTAITVFHTYFNNAVFFLLLPLSLLFIFNASFITRGELLGLAAAALIFVMFFLMSTAALFKKNVRMKLTGLIVSLADIFHKRKPVADFMDNFGTAIERGKQQSQKRPFLLFSLIVFLVADWVSMILTLGYCFAAFGSEVGFGKLLVGFTSGIAAGALSFIPGGLGIFESSMAGMFAILGTGLENAVLAVLLFRFIYYLLPFGFSLLFFGKIILESRREAKTT
ncbi:MAG TPA: flippase-like domain-containing protein [Candidatus Paceibacterota bacterium]|nr:flippase-like domain-containing protein [Candidatus Pacearchaeota archaeon]HRZ51391.1 flippase-like domain-containing protein [Candidatus Paceibacterota bacterium]HSA37113.1 flippase-like domain-containing protein [Candidatus Paceibacterota bacterium]